MNPEPEVRRLKRAAPRRRTIAAVAIGAMALGGLAVLPIIGATAAATVSVSGTVASSVGNAAIDTATITAYRVNGAASTAVATATTNASGVFNFGITLDDTNSYKFKVTKAGFQSSFYSTASTSTPYTPSATVASFGAATAVTPVGTTVLSSPAAGAGSILLVPAGPAVPAVTFGAIQSLDNAGNPVAGGPFPGQRARVSVTVGPGTPGGFITVDGGTAVTADGSQMGTLAGGTTTIDTTIAATPAGGAKTIIVSYSGDGSTAPISAVTKNDVVVAAGSGTVVGTITATAPATAGNILVEAYSNLAPPAIPTIVASGTTDASGAYRLTLPDSTTGYKLRFSKSGVVTEWSGGFFSFSAATASPVNSNVVTVDETLTVPGSTAGAPTITAVTPTTPQVGQTVTFTIAANGAVGGSVSIVGDPAHKAVALSAGTITTVFTASGNQIVDFAYTGSTANPTSTFQRAVTVTGGNIVSGTVTKAGVALAAATVDLFSPNTTTGAPLFTTTTDGSGNYSVAAAPGDYKIRFSEGTVLTEWFNDKPTLRTGDTVTVAGAAVTASASLAVRGSATPTVTITTSPASPTAGEAYNVLVTVNKSGVLAVPTGAVKITGDADLTKVVQLNAAGVGTFTRLDTAPGAVAGLAFDYLGDTVYNQLLNQAATITVGARTSTTLSATPDPVRSGGTVTLDASVLNGSAPVTAGSVTFKNGTSVIGTDTTVAGGVFTITVSTLPVGANYLTAEFSGSAGVGASTTTRALQVTVLPGQGTLQSVTPKRVLQPTSVAAGATTTLTIAPGDLPANAKSVQLNVTVSGVSSTTYVSACAGGNTADVCKTQSIINSNGDDMRNYVIVPLGGPLVNQVTFYNNAGTVLISADLAGFVIDSTDTKRGIFSTYAPVRVGDASGIPMGTKAITTVTFEDVPTGATAVAINVTVSGVTDNTFVSACPPEVSLTDCSKQSVINSNKKDRANFIIVPLGGPQMNKVKFYNNAGRVNLILDLQGYALGNATTGADGRYLAATPVRVLEPSAIAAAEFKTVTLPNVPAGATSVALNLTAAGVKANTYFSACPPELANAECLKTSVLNSRGDDTAGFVIVKLGGAAGNQVKIYNNVGSNLIIADLQGWVIG